MYTLKINGTMYEAKEDKRLLRYLRDDLHLTATKDGCSEGACGTCTVLVDGKKVKACIPKISTLEGKEILTVEGIDAEEMKIYQHCFAEAGAVQCGFCIPGMVISAKSLLDVNLNPTRKEVKQAIRGNLCRCTGYKKIEDAILMVADYFRETKEIPAQPTTLHMNEHFKRIDAWEIRRRNAIKPVDVLPNGQTADANTNIVACLEAVKDVYYQNPYAGIACGFKNAGTGMGKKDIGRILLSVEQGKIHIRTSASCMGQGIGQMVLTEICHVSGLDPALFVFEAADIVRTPNSGTSTASRQTVVTGEAARRIGEKLKCALDSGKTIADLEGQEFF